MGTTLVEDPSRKPQGSKTTLVEPPRSGTRLAMPSNPSATVSATSEEKAAPAELPAELVVGWLVITDGPGRGRSLELGYGMNIIGRNPGNRLVLDFGDDQISGDDHFRVAFDGTHRRFHLVPGKGTNLVYIGDAPLLSPIELVAHAQITVGKTGLRFVPLCSDAWDWH
jgi:hypothetical protein